MPHDARRLPLTVLGGYLGAGKTTLVNRLLRNAGGRRLAVLVNDFGALSIDAALIESRDGNLLSIAGGCVCCSFGSDFMAGLMQMATLDPAPEHLLVEASGVALPGAVARSAALLQAIRLDAVVVLVDAETVRARAADRYLGDTVTRQLAEADLVLLNKTDLVEAAARDALKDWLATLAPRAGLLECERGNVAAEVLLGWRREAGARSTGALAAHALRPPEDAAARYESASFEPAGTLDAAALAARLADPALGLLRAKGIVRDAGDGCVVLQVVGARTALEAAPAGATPGPLVCIGARGRFDRDAIADAIHGSAPAGA